MSVPTTILALYPFLVFFLQAAAPPTAEKPDSVEVLGYINRIPPESAQAAKARHEAVARWRAGMPVIVHRGAHDAAPENTLEAYNAAMDWGADGCEIDIRRSKDGVLYLHHDDDLGRTVEGTGRIKELTYYEILSRPMKRYGLADEQTRVPTLTAFLELARRRAMLIHLDVKEAGLQDEIARRLDQADMWDHIVEVNAANAERLRSHAKVKLLPYKGWWPEGKQAEDPEAIREFLSKPGRMAITDDPRPAVKALGDRELRMRQVPQKLPTTLRATWSPTGIVQTQPASAPKVNR